MGLPLGPHTWTAGWTITAIAALCAGNGVYLRRLRLWAIRPCALIRWRELAMVGPLYAIAE